MSDAQRALIYRIVGEEGNELTFEKLLSLMKLSANLRDFSSDSEDDEPYDGKCGYPDKSSHE
jgi:hypothetical protein